MKRKIGDKMLYIKNKFKNSISSGWKCGAKGGEIPPFLPKPGFPAEKWAQKGVKWGGKNHLFQGGCSHEKTGNESERHVLLQLQKFSVLSQVSLGSSKAKKRR